jgi:glycosyltransferase involved in cell wall biosynthesis
MDTIKIKFINTDLMNHFGAVAEVPYDWGMKRISKGHAILYQPQKNTYTPLYFASPQKIVSPKTSAVMGLRKYPEIVWVQDNNIMGGAELSSRQVINVGRRLGFEIHVLTPQNFDFSILRNAKLLILNNIFTFNSTQMVEIKRAIFEFQIPYIKYEHDMREAYDNRLSFSRRLFKHSKLNMFISPLHLQEYQTKIYDMSPSYTFPLAIDVDRFKPNPKIKRDIKKVVHTSGNLHNKGLVSLFAMTKQRKDLRFEIYVGDNNLIAQMFAKAKNVRLMPRIDNDKMPDVYSGAGYLVHLPTGAWAGERVVLEAALCGCKLIINDNVGHKSWGWDLEDIGALRDKLKVAPYDFWHRVEEVM